MGDEETSEKQTCTQPHDDTDPQQISPDDSYDDNQQTGNNDGKENKKDLEYLTLYISHNSMETAVLRAVLEYLDWPFEISLGDGDMNTDITLCVPERFNSLDITGFNAVFMTLTRLAHLFPSDAFYAGTMIQYFEFSKRATLDEIETQLKGNPEGDLWFVPGFSESTAVDFFLINKLTFERSVHGVDYKDHPFITEYLERDPSLKTAESEDDEPEPSKGVAMYCTIC
jgi:hypothetical protein